MWRIFCVLWGDMPVSSLGSFSKFLGILLVGLFVLTFGANEAQADAMWKSLRGHSACGGVDEQGRLQPACAFQKATYVKKSIKKCPDGSFAAAGACYSCPSGYKKDALRKVTHEKACFKKLSKAQTSPAKKLGSAKCPGGSKYDGRNGGECWKCPSGFGRTAAAVDKWNACGKIGKKAQSAIFVKKACPVAGSIRDPRKGGECWQCPEEFSRTGNAVTGKKACKTNKTFAKATEVSDKKCAPGEIFDFIDGGTCWTCPEGSKRTINGIKSAKACRNNKMQWVMPKRQLYGLFGLGVGGEDILAKLIADRTQIDAAAKKVAQIGGKDEATMLKETWEIIDTHPENSAILSAVLGQYIIEAVAKPTSEQTASEKDLLKRVAQLIQWNRQFIAYQAKQAHENFIATSEAERAKFVKQAGAAVLYAGSGPTPPDYNEALVASIQAGAGVAGPVGAAIVPLLSEGARSVLLPFRRVSEEVIKNGVKTLVQRSAQAAGTGMSTGSVMTAAAAGPMVIALAAGVIVTMEFDKLMAMEKADGQIRQSLAIANRTVNVGTLLQQKDGAGEFLFHWAAVIGAPTKPSANFNRLLAAYKSGTTPTAMPTMPSAPSGSSSSAGMTTGTTTTLLNGTGPENLFGELQQEPAQAAPTPTPAPKVVFMPSLSKAMNDALRRQPRKPASGTMLFELSNQPGSCLTKKDGASEQMTLVACSDFRKAMQIKWDEKRKMLVFAQKYCVQANEEIKLFKMPSKGMFAKNRGAPVRVTSCDTGSYSTRLWRLTQEGYIQKANADQCVTVFEGKGIFMSTCGSDSPNQIWRPWSGG